MEKLGATRESYARVPLQSEDVVPFGRMYEHDEMTPLRRGQVTHQTDSFFISPVRYRVNIDRGWGVAETPP